MRYTPRRTRQLCAAALISAMVIATGGPAAEAAPQAGKGKPTTSETVVPSESVATGDCATTDGYDQVRTTGSLYNLRRHVGADGTKAIAYDGSGIDVALIDTGIAPVDGLDDPGKVVNGPDLSFEAGIGELRHLDTYGHGTHMAGIIAADAPDARGIAPGARLVNVKVADSSGAVDPSQVIAAIDWVVEHRHDNGMNIRVLNLSYGASPHDSYITDPLAFAVERAWNAGIVVVVAGGNDGQTTSSLASPAYDPHIIAVDALYEFESQEDPDSRWAHESTNCLVGETSWGTVHIANNGGADQRKSDVAAPGTTILSLRNPGSRSDQDNPGARVTDRFMRGTGTSQAAAAVAGGVAVLLEARPQLTPDQVKHLLANTGPRVEDVRMMDIESAIRGRTTSVKQNHPAAEGTGSLEALRGGVHVTDAEGNELIGEVSAISGDWNGSSWTGSSWTGSTWTGSSWTGSSWTGGEWLGSSWTGSSWTGSSWTGSSWTGSSWTGSSWTGSSWTGSSWTGSSWTGRSWTGSSWTGSSWTGSTWR